MQQPAYPRPTRSKIIWKPGDLSCRACGKPFGANQQENSSHAEPCAQNHIARGTPFARP